jgi:hypothetical protein
MLLEEVFTDRRTALLADALRAATHPGSG